MINTNDFFDNYEKNVMENKDYYFRDYLCVKEKVKQSSAIYKGEPVKFIYQPMFFTNVDIERFKKLTSMLTCILKKVTSEYLRNPDFRKTFGFPKLMEELILVNPGYDIPFPISRFDVFYPYNDDIKFCELNSDGSSSMNESMVLHDIFKHSNALDGLNEKHTIYDYELFDSLIDVIIENYKKFKKGIYNDPSIAIMDFKGEGIESEFEEFRKRFIRRGYNAVICDPRELRYTGGKIYYNNQRIDLVYRRATTARIVEEAEHIQDFIRAYREGAVCVVGGLVSQIIHNKKIFAVLHDKDMVSFLNKDEIDFIKKHIPYTFILDSNNKELINKTIEIKDNLVLKPCDQFAAHGVYMGRDYSYDEWKELINKAIHDNYLVQELCAIPQIKMLTIENTGMYFEKYNYIIGLFMYNQQFNGFYTRVGRKGIIASIVESFTLPNFVIPEPL